MDAARSQRAPQLDWHPVFVVSIRIPASVQQLLTNSVMLSVAEAYDDRLVFPEEVLIDDSADPGSAFAGCSAPVLVLLIENQGVCSWGVPLDGRDDPPVLVGGALGDQRPPREYATNVHEFVAAREWDHRCLSRDPLLQAQASAVDSTVLATLRANCDEGVTTFGWPCTANYRFERTGVSLMLWACADQCDWWMSADDLPSLRAALAWILPRAGLREFLWSNDRHGTDLLAECGIRNA